MRFFRQFCRLIVALAAFVMLAQPGPALAWWDYGHATVGEIALANVTPRTRAAIKGLLARQALLQTPACPAGTIGEAAVWADCVKKLGDRFSYMSSWHYQDHDVCKPFRFEDGCPGGNCLSRQIERQSRLLKDRQVPVRERLTALILLVHFIGDMEQPLHNAEHDGDAGGNGAKSDYGIAQGSRMNLHGIWDGYLAERAISTPPPLVHAYAAQEKAQLSAGSLEDWIRESWAVARDKVYPLALGTDFCGKPGKSHGAVSETDIEALVPVVREQVVKGGLRLARLLDEALGS